ncbi:VOC family protein [Nocardia carnea]|uniref:VOC family protein n=1 Tax=Nocardia carnea TaxID=37328 RepID=UPI0024579A38|nr:VOC family protein [Nocardia carnea]
MTDDILSFHHVGILTRDLDGLAGRYTSFGFTLSPRSRHSLNTKPGEPMVLGCTANMCALFGGSYIELLGIVDETAPDPWHTKSMADGLRLLNLDTVDADATDARLTAAGLPTSGVLNLQREVDTESGMRTMRARAVHIDPSVTPEVHLGIAQHLTREFVHQPRYLDHPNGARGIASVLIVADDGEFDAIVNRYARIIDGPATPEGPLMVLDMPSGRIEFVKRSESAGLLPGEPVPAASYLGAMTIRVDEVGKARTIIENGGTTTRTSPGGFFVSARDAYGAGLFFTDTD